MPVHDGCRVLLRQQHGGILYPDWKEISQMSYCRQSNWPVREMRHIHCGCDKSRLMLKCQSAASVISGSLLRRIGQLSRQTGCNMNLPSTREHTPVSANAGRRGPQPAARGVLMQIILLAGGFAVSALVVGCASTPSVWSKDEYQPPAQTFAGSRTWRPRATVNPYQRSTKSASGTDAPESGDQ